MNRNSLLNSKKIAPMKEIEERYDRAQQRKELAELSKGCQSRKKEKGQKVRILPRPSRLRAPELEAAAIKLSGFHPFAVSFATALR